MATYHNPTILKAYRKFISTDFGPYWFTVYDVDCPLGVGDSLEIDANTIKVALGSTMFYSLRKEINSIPPPAYEVTIRKNEFTSIDGRLKFREDRRTVLDDGNVEFGITFSFDNISKGQVSGYSASFSNNFDYFWFGLILFHGTAGHSIVPSSFFRRDPYTVNYNYYLNGNNSFGNVYSIANDNARIYFRNISNSDITFGDYLFGDSREYGDPYEDGEFTDPGGETGPGTGGWVLPNEDIAMGGSPYNDMSAGLYRAYAMTAEQLTDFSDQLWNTNVLDALSRYVQNPADLVLSLMSFPFDVESSSSATQIGFNWLDAWNLSSIVTYGYRIPDGHNQHVEFGKIAIPKYSGTFYDYGPYSSIELHLPYIGFVPLKMNECVGRNIYIDYYVDVITGDFTAEVTSDSYDVVEDKFAYGTPILGVYQGNIGKPLPLTQQNLWQVYKKIGETAVAAIVAGAGAGLGAAAGAEADKFVALEAKYKEAGEGGAFAAQLARESADGYQQLSNAGYTVAKRSGLAGAANAILNMQSVNAPIVRNGSVDGSNGRTSSQECFVIISVPDQDVPDNQKILGYPSNIPGPLSKVSGYAEVREIRLHSTVANNSELAEIEEIVRGGIII